MSLVLHDQFVEALKRSRSAAVVFRAAWTGDSLGSALALAGFIERCGTPVEVLCSGFAPHPNFSFLDRIDRVKPALEHAQPLILKMKLGNAELNHLAYEVTDGELTVTITPKGGTFDPAAIKPETGTWKHDLIIAVDSPDLAALGSLYGNHRELFDATPVINIDHDAGNEHFGAINIVDMRASSTAEVVATLIETIDARRIDAETATCLLTGMISKTRSFRTQNVTPATLSLASRLVEAGGRRAEIVERLFRTRSVEALRLWGRVLARLKADREHKIVWSMLARADFIHAGADDTHLPDVIDELISCSPEAEVVCILHEHPQTAGTVRAIVATERAKDAMHLTEPWQPVGHHRRASIEIQNTSLPFVEKQVIDHIRSQLAAVN